MIIDIIKIAKDRPDLFTYSEVKLPGNEKKKRTWYLSIDDVDYYAAMDLLKGKVLDAYIAQKEAASTLSMGEYTKLHNRMKKVGEVWRN